MPKTKRPRKRNARTGVPQDSDRVRSIYWTLNNYTDEEIAHLKSLVPEFLTYVCWGKEIAPTTGTPHLQGYAEPAKQYSCRRLKKIMGNRVSFRFCDGSQSANIAYTQKATTEWFCLGEPKKQGKRTDLDELKQSIRAGASTLQLYDNHGAMWRYRQSAQEYKLLVEQEQQDWRDVEVHVIWGDAGAGKTRVPGDIHGKQNVYKLCYPNSGTVWFDGYDGHDVLLIDDFYGWIKYGWLLQLLDGHYMSIPVKGSYRTAKWTKVYITSNRAPEHWYTRGMTPALKRRLTTITHKKLDDSEKCSDVGA